MDLAPSSNDDEVRAIFWVLFGALCHQRGITPLHASAIDVANGCVAFVSAQRQVDVGYDLPGAAMTSSAMMFASCSPARRTLADVAWH
jgi:hypothetical protein